MIRRWNPSSVAAPIGQYSHVAAVPDGHELLFISGQVGVSEDGTLAGPDAYTQTHQVLLNLESVLRAAAAGPEHLVKLMTLVAGVEHVTGCRAARAEVFARWYPNGDWPAQTLAVVAGLAAPELTVEIEAVAAVPR